MRGCFHDRVFSHPPKPKGLRRRTAQVGNKSKQKPAGGSEPHSSTQIRSASPTCDCAFPPHLPLHSSQSPKVQGLSYFFIFLNSSSHAAVSTERLQSLPGTNASGAACGTKPNPSLEWDLILQLVALPPSYHQGQDARYHKNAVSPARKPSF